MVRLAPAPAGAVGPEQLYAYGAARRAATRLVCKACCVLCAVWYGAVVPATAVAVGVTAAAHASVCVLQSEPLEPGALVADAGALAAP